MIKAVADERSSVVRGPVYIYWPFFVALRESVLRRE